MSRTIFRAFLLSVLALVWLNVAALPAFAANEVYAVQVGTVYYEATAQGTKVSDTVVAKEKITHLFADANVVQVGREDERFLGCTQLQVIDFSKATSLRTIYSETFRNCTNLHTVVLPASVRDIQSGAFRGCTSLKTVDLSATAVTKVSNHLFNGCTSLEKVVFPAALNEIDYYAFHGCTSFVLDSSVQGTQLQTVRNHAFYGCSSIVSVAMPSSLKTLESNAFAQCVNFSSLALGVVPPSVKPDTFTNCAQTSVLKIDKEAVDTYQAVNDGSTADLYWYGWLTEQINVSDALKLSVTGWEYQANGAPTALLTNHDVAVKSNITYFYATEEDGAYQSLEKLPRSSAGEIEVGTYWCLAVYDAPCEHGSVRGTFKVTPKEITATIWVLGITKVYDGTTDIVGMQPTVVMEGALKKDDVSAKGKFAYASAEVGEGKTIEAKDLALVGADAENYTLKATVASQNGAVITKASVTIPYPTASDINKGETLKESTLTEGDMSNVKVAGKWEWVDDTTKPDETGKFPATFMPDDGNYAPYGPVDVQVIVHDKTIGAGGDSGSDDATGTTGGDGENGDGTGDGGDGNHGAAGDGTGNDGVLGALGGLFGGDRTDIEDDRVPLLSALSSRDGWALLNLVLCVTALSAGVVFVLNYVAQRSALQEQTAEEEEEKARAKWNDLMHLCGVVLAALSVLLFLLTEDMTTQMRFVDKWTLAMLLFVLLQGCLAFYMKKAEQELEAPVSAKTQMNPTVRRSMQSAARKTEESTVKSSEKAKTLVAKESRAQTVTGKREKKRSSLFYRGKH